MVEFEANGIKYTVVQKAKFKFNFLEDGKLRYELLSAHDLITFLTMKITSAASMIKILNDLNANGGSFQTLTDKTRVSLAYDTTPYDTTIAVTYDYGTENQETLVYRDVDTIKRYPYWLTFLPFLIFYVWYRFYG